MTEKRVIYEGVTLESVQQSIRQIFREETASLRSRAGEADHPGLGWISNAEAMKLLAVSRPTLQRWRSSGTLPYAKIGSSVWYRRSDVEALLEAHLVTEAA